MLPHLLTKNAMLLESLQASMLHCLAHPSVLEGLEEGKGPG